MFETMNFGGENYGCIRNYLESQKNLKQKPGKGCEMYGRGTSNIIFIQKNGPNLENTKVTITKKFPDLDKIKKELSQLIKE